MTKGNGSDLITDLGTDDIVRLNGYSLTSFDQLLDNITQEGANLRLDLGGGESLVFADTRQSANFMPDQFELSLDRSALTRHLATISIRSNCTMARPGCGKRNIGGRPKRVPPCPEMASFNGTSIRPMRHNRSANPFSVNNGVLTITAKETPDAISAEVNGL